MEGVKSTRPVGGFTGKCAVFFPDFFHKKMEKFAIFGGSPPLVLPPRFHGCSSPGSNITPQSARARIGQRTWASVAEQVKPARMMPTSPPSCKCTTRRYAFGRLRAVLCSRTPGSRATSGRARPRVPRRTRCACAARACACSGPVRVRGCELTRSASRQAPQRTASAAPYNPT